MGIQKKLLLSFLTLLLLPLVILFMLSYSRMTSIMLERIGTAEASMLEGNAKVAYRVFSDMSRILMTLSLDMDVKLLMSNAMEGEKWDNYDYEQIVLSRRVFGSIQLLTATTPFRVIVVPAQGQYYSNAGEIDQRVEGLRDSVLFSQVAEDLTGAIHWVDLDGNREYFSALIPVKGRYTSEPLGIICVELSKEYLLSMINQNHEVRSIQLLLEDNRLYGLQAGGGTALENPSFSPNAGWYTAEDAGHRTMLAYSSPFFSTWRLVTVTGYDRIFDSMFQMRLEISLVSALCLVIFALIALRISRSFSRPIVNLSDQMRLVENGDFSQRVRPDRKDEIGVLQRNFNSMLDRLLLLMEDIRLKERQRWEAEMNVLQMQIQPHFLFNALTSIRWAAAMKEDAAEKMTVSLIALLKMTIRKGSEKITLSEECEMLGHYINFQNLRSVNQVRLELSIEPSLERFPIPRFIMQPLIENSILHGLREQTDGFIKVSAAIANGADIIIRVVDNGCGFPPDVTPGERSGSPTVSGFNSIGVQNVRERLVLYYPGRASIRLGNWEEAGAVAGAEVEIQIEGGLEYDAESNDCG